MRQQKILFSEVKTYDSYRRAARRGFSRTGSKGMEGL